MASNAFTAIYRYGVWGGGNLKSVIGGSGGGSEPSHAEPYMKLLTTFLKEKQITSVVDLGSGDWQFSRLIDWNGIRYTGIDCVPEVVNEVATSFTTDTITFRCLDFSNAPGDLPSADLAILKDVIQHWPNEVITRFLREIISLRLYKYILITNCCNQGVTRYSEMGGSEPLSPTMMPLLEFSPMELLRYSTKSVSLITLVD
jgi:SAM-dependent methyltransferase